MTDSRARFWLIPEAVALVVAAVGVLAFSDRTWSTSVYGGAIGVFAIAEAMRRQSRSARAALIVAGVLLWIAAVFSR